MQQPLRSYKNACPINWTGIFVWQLFENQSAHCLTKEAEP
jgi:hypothetical protein